MTQTRMTWLVYSVLITTLLLPRIGLLFNGLDSQRIWDTNTSAAFAWLSAAKSGNLGNFYHADQKYPLLGSYTFIPVTALYYGGARLFGIYQSATDFTRAYALGATHLFFWLRLQMLFINFAAIYILYRTVKRVTPSAPRAALYAVLLAGVDFYVTLFSVTPRIHSFAFAAGVLTLAASCRLLAQKSWRNYLCAFGAAALGASMAQSGFPLLVLPILAHLYNEKKQSWSLNFSKKILFGLALFAVGTVIIGYPRLLFAAFDPSIHSLEVLLSSEHSRPLFGLHAVWPFIFTYFVATVPLVTWLILSVFWYTLCCAKRQRIHIAPVDVVAICHIVVFFLLFGFSDVTTGRFILAALPSIFFLLGRLFIQLEKKPVVWYVALALFALQAYGVGQLGMIAWRGDTRSEAARFLLAHSAKSDQILSTVDHEFLGITPTPASIQTGDVGVVGMKDKILVDNQWQGGKSRPFTRWDPTVDKIGDKDLAKFKYLVVAADNPARYLAEEKLLGSNFTVIKTFFATHTADTKSKASIPWDNISPAPLWSLALALRQFRAFGPTIFIYQHK